jgi:hypothetical protein
MTNVSHPVALLDALHRLQEMGCANPDALMLALAVWNGIAPEGGFLLGEEREQFEALYLEALNIPGIPPGQSFDVLETCYLNWAVVAHVAHCYQWAGDAMKSNALKVHADALYKLRDALMALDPRCRT